MRVGDWVEVSQAYFTNRCQANPVRVNDGFVRFKIPSGATLDGIHGRSRGIKLTAKVFECITHFRETTHDGEKSWFNGDNILIRQRDNSLFIHSEVDGSVKFCTTVDYLHELQSIFRNIEKHDLHIIEDKIINV